MSAIKRQYAFGSRLREMRVEKGLSQQALADRCMGRITKSNISRLEIYPEQQPTLQNVETLSKALGWPIDEARQLAGYAKANFEWPEATTSELVYVLEKYPVLSETSRKFVREQIERLIGFILAVEEDLRDERLTPSTEEIPSIRLEDLSKKRGQRKKRK